jgi:ornithine cyclodeaminase/alanine dehydrogenase-like protein (mu-crystallin family)
VSSHLSCLCETNSTRRSLGSSCLPQLSHLDIFNRSAERLNDLVSILRERLPTLSIESHLLSDRAALEAAVSAADVICLCTPSTEDLFPSYWLKDRVHITAIGSYKPHMREFDLQALVKSGRTSTVLVDSKEACLAEAGELQFLKGTRQEDLVLDLGILLCEDGSVDEKAFNYLPGSRVTVFKVGVVLCTARL